MTARKRVAWVLGIASVVFVLLIVVPTLLRVTPREQAEARFIGDMRHFAAAQTIYSTVNGGFYESRLECLIRPADCIPGHAPGGPAFIDESLVGLPTQDGYERRFLAGPAVPAERIAEAGASASSIEAWALFSTPIRRATGDRPARSYCIDHTGVLRATEDPVVPGRDDSSCPQSWRHF